MRLQSVCMDTFTLTVLCNRLIDLDHFNGGSGPGGVRNVGTSRLLPSIEYLGSDDKLRDDYCSTKLSRTVW